MKALIFPLLLLLASVTAIMADDAKPEIKPDEVRNVPTVDVTDLTEGKKAEELAGKIVKLRFKSRGPTPVQDEQGIHPGELREYNAKSGQVDRVSIEVSLEQRAWYYKLTTVTDGPKILVYVRVVGHVEDKVWVKILGRELRNAVAKPEFIW